MGEPGLHREVLPPELTRHPWTLPKRVMSIIKLMSEMHTLLMELAEQPDFRSERRLAYEFG